MTCFRVLSRNRLVSHGSRYIDLMQAPPYLESCGGGQCLERVYGITSKRVVKLFCNSEDVFCNILRQHRLALMIVPPLRLLLKLLMQLSPRGASPSTSSEPHEASEGQGVLICFEFRLALDTTITIAVSEQFSRNVSIFLENIILTILLL